MRSRGCCRCAKAGPSPSMRIERVLSILATNSIFNVLSEKNVTGQPIAVDKAFEPALPDGAPSGIEILPFAVPGKGAWYLEGKAHPAGTDGAGDTLGLRIADKSSGKHFLFPRRLRRRHRRSEIPARGRLGDLLRRHGVARRRVDRGRPRQQDRARHGTYRDVRRSTARSKALPASISTGRCFCISITPTRCG